MSIQHAVIADPYIHEPKGVASAAVDTVYVADGLGSGVWAPPPMNTNNPVIENLLDSYNVAAKQGPALLDTTYQVVFGPASGTGADPVQISAAGALTINTTGSYFLHVELQYGRVAGAGISTLHFRQKINGVMGPRVFTAVIDNANVTHILTIEDASQYTAGDVIIFEMVRDPAGNNSGSLLSGVVTATGWAASPNARILVQRLIHG